MSLTENYLVPDFYYTESGIPVLYDNRFGNGNRETPILSPSYQMRLEESMPEINLTSEQRMRIEALESMLPQSLSSSSSSSLISSESTPLLRQSISPSQYENYNSKLLSTTNNTTEICCKSNKMTNIHLKLGNNSNENSVKQNHCDRPTNENNFKFNEKPKKLLTKRSTIYDYKRPKPIINSPGTPTITARIETPQAIAATTCVPDENNIDDSCNQIDSNRHLYDDGNNINNTNCYNSYENLGLISWNSNDKECKTFINNKIKELQSKENGKVRECYQSLQQLPQLHFADHFNCSKSTTAATGSPKSTENSIFIKSPAGKLINKKLLYNQLLNDTQNFGNFNIKKNLNENSNKILYKYYHNRIQLDNNGNVRSNCCSNDNNLNQNYSNDIVFDDVDSSNNCSNDMNDNNDDDVDSNDIIYQIDDEYDDLNDF